MVDRDTVERVAAEIRQMSAAGLDTTAKVEEFFTLYRPILAGLARSFASKWRLEAADLYGEALVAAMECIEHLRTGREFPNFGGYVYLSVRGHLRQQMYRRHLVRMKSEGKSKSEVLPFTGDMCLLLAELPAPDAAARRMLWFKLETSGYLTPREMQLAKLLYADYTMAEIAKLLGISRSTVYLHLEDLRQVLPLILGQ